MSTCVNRHFALSHNRGSPRRLEGDHVKGREVREGGVHRVWGGGGGVGVGVGEGGRGTRRDRGRKGCNYWMSNLYEDSCSCIGSPSQKQSSCLWLQHVPMVYAHNFHGPMYALLPYSTYIGPTDNL